MKKNNYLRWVGVVALTLGLFFNLQYALIDYGMHGNTLGSQLTAQASSSGSGSGSGSGILWQSVETVTPCEYEEETTYWLCGGVIFYVNMGGCIKKVGNLKFNGVMTRCDDGWNLCRERCVGKSGSGSQT